MVNTMALPVELLRDSFALAAAREPALLGRFYDELFTRAPELEPMFHRRRGEQAEMLRGALAAVLEHLEDPRGCPKRSARSAHVMPATA